ncbi:DUF6234 family protein [Streptomyces sp. NBC_00696]|uniref:DUF6234 family protein n=2 Tax=Streptomyces sp. NBC_00696 TaxID=2903672 RepID=UPI002E34DD43|nr:DUF6234 family protein [Streptomyces sp. NBC_00696]
MLMTPRTCRMDSGRVSTDPERTGRAVAISVGLAVLELLALGLIWFFWIASYWSSFGDQAYGAPPGPYLQKAMFVAAAALVAAVAAGVRRVPVVALTQLVMVLAMCAALTSAKAAGERIYDSSYRNACLSGLACDAPSPPR